MLIISYDDVTKSSGFNKYCNEWAFKSDLLIGPNYSGRNMSYQSTCMLQYEHWHFNGPTGDGERNDA